MFGKVKEWTKDHEVELMAVGSSLVVASGLVAMFCLGMKTDSKLKIAGVAQLCADGFIKWHDPSTGAEIPIETAQKLATDFYCK